MEVADTFSFLLGRWALERSLTDHRSGVDGKFVGDVTIAGLPDGPDSRARYDEVGTMCFGEHEGPGIASSRSCPARQRRGDASLRRREPLRRPRPPERTLEEFSPLQ